MIIPPRREGEIEAENDKFQGEGKRLEVRRKRPNLVLSHLKRLGIDREIFFYAYKRNWSNKKICKYVTSKLPVYNKVQAKKYLLAYLLSDGEVTIREQKGNIEEALKFAKEWNRYSGYGSDMKVLTNWIKKGNVIHKQYKLTISHLTFVLAASLSYLLMTYAEIEKRESPNHYFLKSIFHLLFYEKGFSDIHYEHKFTMYGDYVYSDVVASDESMLIVGEAGGVQLWKVMGLLKAKRVSELYILPHWTTVKHHPFKKEFKSLDLHYFSAERGAEL